VNWKEAVEIMVGRHGHERYRSLCSEDRHDHLAWRAEMIRKASGEPPPPFVPVPPSFIPAMPTIPTMILDHRAFRACPYSSDFVAGCCHAPATARCHWKAATVTLPTCLDCVKEMA
jgi:hypothetical protein